MQIHELDFVSLFRNPIFLSGFTSLVGAQFIKTIITLIRSRKSVDKDALFVFFWRTGGMPSSHSATAVSISAAIAFTDGFNDLFILSLFVTLITIRDALGVRRSAGLQARALNRLGSDLSERQIITYEPVKEIHGHTLAEVMVGSLLGFGIALAFCVF
ncbi:MAG: divergent PAP2 family protein [Spirochaetaceae bacterium]|nr:divergent PAP2 family protein [Spirochaetaceae bacterium]